MRHILILFFAVAILIGIDAAAFNGHYRETVWQSAKYQADHFNGQIRNWLSSMGL